MSTPTPIPDPTFLSSIIPDEYAVFVAYFAMFVIAIVCVHVGAHLSLNPFDHDGERKGETVNQSDARWFPIMGSIMLLSLYLVVRFFGKDLLDYVLLVYFGIVGTLALASSISAILISFKPEIRGTKTYHYSWKIPFMQDPLVLDFTRDYFFTVPLSLFIVGGYTLSKNWILNNAIAIAFVIQGVERINLGGFIVGAILLGGLFFYDIFWVFGTDVMVTVAKNVDWPIKIMFPRSYVTYQMAMLGLGDIVIPGVFIALLLRFDVHLQKGRGGKRNVYYIVVFVAYALAILTALTIMHTFKAAQPVLLYIVPYCLISVVVLAFIRGEFKELLTYKEGEDEEQEQEEKSDGDVVAAQEPPYTPTGIHHMERRSQSGIRQRKKE